MRSIVRYNLGELIGDRTNQKFAAALASPEHSLAGDAYRCGPCDFDLRGLSVAPNPMPHPATLSPSPPDWIRGPLARRRRRLEFFQPRRDLHGHPNRLGHERFVDLEIAFVLGEVSLPMRLVENSPVSGPKVHRVLQALEHEIAAIGPEAVPSQRSQRQRVCRVVCEVELAFETEFAAVGVVQASFPRLKQAVELASGRPRVFSWYLSTAQWDLCRKQDVTPTF